jgi:GH35 family endo-1,4-beta-xylanase
LVWAKSVPSWLPSNSRELEQVLQRRVTATTSSFKGLIDFWDVVNEPTLSPLDKNPVGQWMKVQTTAAATATILDWAYSSSPETSLIVNDFYTGVEYYSLLKEVQRQGSKFDIVGIQAHMHSGAYPLDWVWAICERFKELGMPLHFTEVTVLSGALKTDSDWQSYRTGWETTLEGENIQATYVEALYRLLFSHPSVQAITWWDFSDLGAWRGAPAGLLRKDMTPKPAYDKLAKLIREEWWTNTEIKADRWGRAKFRGFYGTYRLIAEKDGRRTEAIVHL